MVVDETLLERLSDSEAEERLHRSGVVLIACGSVEQHGPHLPAGTDALIAEAVTSRVADHLDGIMFPFTPLGVTPFHMAYSSTVTLEPATFVALVRDVARSAARHGARFFAAINWHEGNIPALALALDEVQRSEGLRCVAVQACYVAAEMLSDEAGPLSHGGQIETMLVQAEHEHLVHLERITAVPEAPDAQIRDTLRRDQQYQPVISDVREISPEGWHGDPRRADPDRGRAALDTLAGRIADRLAAIREAMGP